MLNEFGEVLENASLENYNTYGIKTFTKYLIKVQSIKKLLLLLDYIKKNNIDFMILGKGSNVILPDEKFQGIIISLEKLNNVVIKNNMVESEAGIMLSLLSQKVMKEGLSGLEYLALIPGTLGGALYGNAGVKEHDIYEYVKKVTIIRNNKLLVLEKEKINYSYRNTEFKENNDIIVKCEFEFLKGDIEKMKEIVKTQREKRLKTQPLELRNAGSVFKNPENTYAGKLIEECGLKGFKVGDAQISEKHANFIVNLGNATSKDIKELIEIAKNTVWEKFKIELELEQIIVNW